jgi:hypothetical protein
MPDDDVIRSRRYRRHRKGDHSMCRHPAGQAPVRAVPPEPAGELDAQAEMVALARRLAAAHEAAPDRADVARELRATLQAIGQPGPAGDDLDGLLRELQR